MLGFGYPIDKDSQWNDAIYNPINKHFILHDVRSSQVSFLFISPDVWSWHVMAYIGKWATPLYQPSSFISWPTIAIKMMASSREKNTLTTRASGSRVSHSSDIPGITGSSSIFLAQQKGRRPRDSMILLPLSWGITAVRPTRGYDLLFIYTNARMTSLS